MEGGSVILSVDEAATAIGRSVRTVKRWQQRGLLPRGKVDTLDAERVRDQCRENRTRNLPVVFDDKQMTSAD